MTTLNIFKGEEFYFCKVPLDESATAFRWRKEAIMPITKEVFQKFRTDPKSCRFEEKYALFRMELEKRRVHWQEGACFLKVDKQNVIVSTIHQLSSINFYK